jgi:hypothetical protein
MDLDAPALSCRWGVASAKHGLVLSLIVAPRGNEARFATLINEIVEPSLAVPSQAKAHIAAIRGYCIAIFLHIFKLKVGRFDAVTYASELVANADFRKFDDGLRMTLDCSPEFADALEARYWTNFAKTGDPNGVGLPEWPRYGASAEAVMELGDRTGPMPVLDPKRKTLFDAYLASRLSN